VPDHAAPSQQDDATEVRVTWAELFFDLVFVFAVTEVSALLRGEMSWLGVVRALVVFVPIYWVWVGTCVYANTHDIDTALHRLSVLAIGLVGLFMALAVPVAYHSGGVLFGACYLAARAVLFALARRHGGFLPPTYLVALAVSGPLLLIGGFLPPPTRVVVWAVAALTDLATPAVNRQQLLRVRFAPGHLAERFGGFLIIALGESIVAIGAPAAASHSARRDHRGRGRVGRRDRAPRRSAGRRPGRVAVRWVRVVSGDVRLPAVAHVRDGVADPAERGGRGRGVAAGGAVRAGTGRVERAGGRRGGVERGGARHGAPSAKVKGVSRCATSPCSAVRPILGWPRRSAPISARRCIRSG
jgi:hypothetical protein